MDKYLLEILKDVNTIIIPGLGALTITNADSGEIMFMPYLKHDDGKLSAYIAEKEGWDENEAKNLIAKYVRDIQTKLDQGDSYDMFQFGSFLKDENGDVEFKNWDKDSTTTNTKDDVEEVIVAPVEIQEEKESKQEAEEEALAKKKEQDQKEADEVKEAAELAEKKKLEEEAKAKEAAQVAAKKALEKENKPSAPQTEQVEVVRDKAFNIEEKEELSKNVEKLKTLKEQQASKKERKKRGAGFYMLIALIVILVGGGTFIGLNYDNFKQHIPFLADNTEEVDPDHDEINKMKEIMGDDEDDVLEENEPEENQMDDDETRVEEVVEEEVEKEPEIIEPITPPSNNTANSETPYHIVAGAFSSAENASKLATKLKGEGYPATTFARGNMTIVSLSSHASNSEAATALKEAQAVVPKGWILFWK